MNEYVKRNLLSLMLVITMLVVAVHYLFFVSSINEDRNCRGKYNTLVVEAVDRSNFLLKDGYDSQNQTIDSLVAAFVEGQSGGDPSAALQMALAKAKSDRVNLDKRFSENIIPELPKCFK